MSMECDTRLAMMALRDRAKHTTTPAPRRNHISRRARNTAVSPSAMAAFALTLFTRGA